MVKVKLVKANRKGYNHHLLVLDPCILGHMFSEHLASAFPGTLSHCLQPFSELFHFYQP